MSPDGVRNTTRKVPVPRFRCGSGHTLLNDQLPVGQAGEINGEHYSEVIMRLAAMEVEG